MTFKLKVLLWLGAVFASVTAAVLFRVPLQSEAWWGSAVIASAFFAFYAVAFESSRWAMTAVPGFIVAVVGISYFRFHRSEPIAWVVLAAVVALGLANAVFVRRLQRH